jgi:hypothetical protein
MNIKSLFNNNNDTDEQKKLKLLRLDLRKLQ